MTSPPAPTQLLDLPLEIVKLIADCLQPPDAASFALCNRILSTFLGSTYWKLMRYDSAETSQRKQFLTTIPGDIPFWFFCHWCSNIHPRKGVGPPRRAFRPRRPLRCFESLLGPTLWTYLHLHDGVFLYNFEFHHLQLAMERHRLGDQYGISTNSLSLLEVRESRESDVRQCLTKLLLVDAWVCAHPDRLCLRIQNCVVYCYKDLEPVCKQLEFIWICHHLKLPPLVDDWFICNENASKMPKIEVQRCIPCNMDYQPEVEDFGSDGVLLVVTKRLDLGPGIGLVHHPIDPAWRIVYPENLLDWCEGVKPSSEPGEVRSSFERERGGLSQRTLLLQNRSYLTEERNKKEMQRVLPRVWILQLHNPIPHSQ